VVAGRPSSMPAAASTNDPVQIDTRRAPGRMPSNKPVDRAQSAGSLSVWQDGMITVSAVARISAPC